MPASCLFCNEEERKYKPPEHTDFICSRCVQLLFGASLEDLIRAYNKAIKEGYLKKASAIEKFLGKGIRNEQRRPATKKRGRYSNRKRINRAIGNQKERIKRVQA